LLLLLPLLAKWLALEPCAGPKVLLALPLRLPLTARAYVCGGGGDGGGGGGGGRGVASESPPLSSSSSRPLSSASNRRFWACRLHRKRDAHAYVSSVSPCGHRLNGKRVPLRRRLL
jgi:hypothetical protein